MDCGGNSLSDERIGEALIKEVMEEELKDVATEDVPSLSPLVHQGQTDQEKIIVYQVSKLIKTIGNKLQDDVEYQQFNDSIDNLARIPGCKWDQFKQVAYKVFEDQITWERIALLFIAAGRLAVRLVEARLPQTILEFAKWVMDFFRQRLLGWIRNHGGWISSFSELAIAPLRAVSRGPVYGVLLFVAGLTLGCLVTQRLMQHQ
uniref:Bcl-2 Bcl-2 homology region 1-3 domain-containing protein n=1 Tax=Neogobius melanostomus TaxID=47308 RepID=A0A8C6WRU0_9GOBI